MFRKEANLNISLGSNKVNTIKQVQFFLDFSQEVAQYVSYDCLLPFMGISAFLSMIYQIQNKNVTKIFALF